MNWVTFAGAILAIELGLLGVSAWFWYLKRGRRPFFCFLVSAVLSALAGSLAQSFLGFHAGPFELYDRWIGYLYIGYLYCPRLFFPDTIILLILSGISAILGLYFLIQSKQVSNKSSEPQSAD